MKSKSCINEPLPTDALKQRLMNDWIAGDIRLNAEMSYLADVYSKSLPEGVMAAQIAEYLNDYFKGERRLLIEGCFKGLGSTERSRAFLNFIQEASDDRFRSIVYFYLMYGTDVTHDELAQIVTRLREYHIEKVTTEDTKMLFDPESLCFYKLKKRLSAIQSAQSFLELTWDLYPRKPFVQRYRGLCKKMLKEVTK